MAPGCAIRAKRPGLSWRPASPIPLPRATRSSLASWRWWWLFPESGSILGESRGDVSAGGREIAVEMVRIVMRVRDSRFLTGQHLIQHYLYRVLVVTDREAASKGQDSRWGVADRDPAAGTGQHFHVVPVVTNTYGLLQTKSQEIRHMQ